MAVLVTGGTVAIGAEVARLLLDRGEERVVLFDRNPSTRRLGDAAGRVEVVRGDLGIFSHVLDAVDRVRPAAIYHLGAMLSLLCEADPPAAIQSNALGTFHVLEAARLFGVPPVLFASSIGTYRDDLGDGPLADATLQRPTLLYGATKLFGELLGRFYRRKYGLDFRGLRYPAIVAPGVTTPGVLQYTSWVIEAAANAIPFTITVEPRTRPPALYVKDAARAMIELAAAPPGADPDRQLSGDGDGADAHGGGVGRAGPRPRAGRADRLCPGSRAASAARPDGAAHRRPQRARNGVGSRLTGRRRWSTTSCRSCASIRSATPRDCRSASTLDQAIEDLLATRRKLREQMREHLPPVFLFGHSLAGLVTATSMVGDQSGLSGAILLAPTVKYAVSPLVRRVAQVAAFLVPTLKAPLPEPDDPFVLTRLPEALERLSRDALTGEPGGPG